MSPMTPDDLDPDAYEDRISQARRLAKQALAAERRGE
jgi:hypothetical protein